MATSWQYSDVWFFEAVARAAPESGTAGLRSVILEGDTINHAIFNPDEIEKAVNRLQYAGLLVERNGRFGLTDKGRELRARVPDELHMHERLRWVQSEIPRLEVDPPMTWQLDPRYFERSATFAVERWWRAIAGFLRLFRRRS